MKRAGTWHRGLSLFLAAFFSAVSCGDAAWAGAADVQPPLPSDITLTCRFALSAQTAQEARLFDCNAATYWESGRDGYLQFYKPAGEATLSLLWAKAPGTLALKYEMEDTYRPLWFYDPAQGGEIPQSIVLPSAPGFFRLIAENVGLSLAEVRIHKGVVEHFFSAQGYPDSPTLTQPGLDSYKPLKLNARVSQRIKGMQQRLGELGYYQGKADGKLGEATYVALMHFQKANGVYPSGCYEPATARALESSAAVAAADLGAEAAQAAQTSAAPGGLRTLWNRTASDFVAFLRGCVGSGYVYGASGEICTPTVRGAAARLYPEYASLLKGYARLWDGQPVYDCNGLMRAFLESSQGPFPEAWQVNVNGAVNTWMLEMGPIETMPRQPGILLLQESATVPNSYTHIGAYVGEGMCIHARGHHYGVIMEPMPQLWTHWARPVWLTMDLPKEPERPWPGYMAPGDTVLVDSTSGGTIVLYKKPEKDIRYRTSIKLPNHTRLTVEAYVEGAPFWRKVTVLSGDDTVTGYVYAKDLSPLP